jgi:hypothetical protein
MKKKWARIQFLYKGRRNWKNVCQIIKTRHNDTKKPAHGKNERNI